MVRQESRIPDRPTVLPDERLPYLCECGDVGCEKCVPLTPREYEELPAEPPGLALAPGHELEDLAGEGDGDGAGDGAGQV